MLGSNRLTNPRSPGRNQFPAIALGETASSIEEHLEKVRVRTIQE
jgi:hypothetical protein